MGFLSLLTSHFSLFILKKILFEITTPEGAVLKNEIDSLTCTTRAGQVTILPGHIPLVAPVVTGELVIRINGEETSLVVAGGFLQVDPAPAGQEERIGNRVIILADAAERAEEIDEDRARQARTRAEQAMAEYRNADAVKYIEATAAFERAFARLKVAERKRARSPQRDISTR